MTKKQEGAVLAFYIGKKSLNPATTLVDRLICWIDGSDYSHVELLVKKIDGNTYLSISSSPRDGGLRIKPICFDPAHWEFLPVSIDMDYALSWFYKRQGFGYDWFGLLRTQVPFAINPVKRLFCSEAVAEMMQLVDPASFGIKKLYEHCLNDFKQYVAKP